MRRSLLFSVIGIIMMLFPVTNLFAQPSLQGNPASRTFQVADIHVGLDLTPTQLDWNAIHAEDQLREAQKLPERAGFNLPVNKSIDNSGEWTMLPDGRMMWRIKLEATGAVSLGLVFDQFQLPDNAELYVYNEAKNFVIGAFTSENNNPKNIFSTYVIPGSSIIVEYIEQPDPASSRAQRKMNAVINGQVVGESQIGGIAEDVDYQPQGVLNIGSLIYIYQNPMEESYRLGESGTCQVNVNCSPEGDDWQVEKRGVAKILFKESGSWYFCSGTLVNNTALNATPYFLTAYHCGAIASASDHDEWQFYFNYEYTGCTSTGTVANNMITGCVKRAEGNISGGTDFQLLELYQTPPTSYNVYYNGWDRSGLTTTGGVSIHHPKGDAKKISTFTGTTYSATWNGTETGATNGHWTFPSWALTTNGQGVSEGGSSGSPLFNNSGRVIGTLSGGLSECGGPYSGDLYGKFSIHWQNAVNGTGNAYELKYWLDPAGTNPNTLDGLDPNANTNPPAADFTANMTTAVEGQTISFTDLSTNVPTSWQWSFSGGYPATSNLRNPTVQWMTAGTYSVTMTSTNAYGSDTETKTGYITISAYTTSTTNPVVVGTGTSTQNNYPYPLGATSRYERSASIYTSADIGRSGFLDSLGWYPTVTSTVYRPIKIYVKHTASSTLTAGTWASLTSGATLVYDDSIITTASAWKMFKLQEEFYYNGTSNLLVLVEQNKNASINANAKCRYTTNSGSTHETWTSTTADTPPAGNGSVSTSRPNIRLKFKVFTAPVALFTAGDGTVLYTQGFDSTWLPTNWTTTITNSSYTWKQGNPSASPYNSIDAGNVASAVVPWVAANQDEWLISPQISTAAYSGRPLAIKFHMGFGRQYLSPGATLSFKISTNNGSSWTQLWNAIGDATEPTGTAWAWRLINIDLSAYAGQNVKFAWQYVGNDGDLMALDGVKVYINETPTQVTLYEGDYLQYTDLSTGNPLAWNWALTGASPNTSALQSPKQQYNVAGIYNSSLTVGNPYGEDTETKTNFVKVLGRAPIADFWAQGNLTTINYEPFIPPGGSVDYYDFSTRVPTGWNWTFENGTPATSTSQNPVGVTYSATGEFDATLRITNASGADTATWPDFVNVAGTKFVTNLYPWDDLSYYSMTSGFLPGHNNYSMNKYAEFFDNDYAATITKVRFAVAKAIGAGKTINVVVWDGSTGSPGTRLYTQTYNISDFDSLAYDTVTFTTPVNVTGDFFVGYEINYDATHNYTTHMFCPYMAVDRGEGEPTTAWVMYNSNWYLIDVLLDGLATAIAIEPEVTYTGFALPTVTATATPGCNIGSVTLTSTVNTNQTFYLLTGTGTPVANWTGTTDTHTFTGLANGTYKGYTVAGTVTSPNSNTVTLTNISASPVSVNIVSSPSGSICPGTSVTFTATPTNGGATPAYQWYEGGSAVGTGTNTYTTTGLTTGEAVYVVLTSSETCVTGNPATSNTINTTVNANNAVSVSIAASPSGAICSGTSVTFTATPVNGGGAPSYQWYEGGAPVGTGTSTYTTTGLTTGEAVYCVLTSNVSCPTGNPATSNTITTTVNPNLPVSVSITANPGTTICSGTSVTFTATPVNGGTSPVYQWKVNGVNVGPNSPTYTSSTLATGNTVTCQVTSNATCPTGNPATSNTLTMTVNPNLPASVSIAANPGTTICAGTSVTFTATPTNGGTTPSYQWKLNGGNVGSSSTTYTNAALATGDVVTCQLISNATCATGSPATSNALTMTVNPNLPVSVSITANPGTTICTGTSVTFTATAVNPGTTPVYQWKLNGGNVGLNSTTYTNAALVTGDIVTCQLTSNATCATGSPATSNALTMTVNSSLPVSVSIAANPGNNICAGTNVTFTATPTNGGTTPGYQWKVNGTNVVTGATYASTSFTQGQIVTCVLTSNEGCATGNPATSNAVTMTVTANATPAVSIAASATTICAGTSVTFTATPTDGGATPFYQWKLNGGNVGSNSTTYTSNTLATGDIVTCSMTSALTCTVENPVTSNSITMTVNPNKPVSVGISASATTICTGTTVNFTATPSNGGTTPSYQWYVDATPVGTGSTYSSSTLSNGNNVICVLTSNEACATGNPATSNVIPMIVNSSLPVSVSIAANPGSSICAGTSVTFTATPTNGGTTPTYTWKVNGVTQGTNSPTYTTSSLTNGQIVTCVLASSEGCATGSPATSNAITMAVTSNSAVSVSVAASATTICDGTSVTFTATPTNGGTPTYQWYLNGLAVGSNSATYTNAALTTGNTVNCIMTSSLACTTGNPATSNTVNMTVNPNNPVSVSISANPGTTVCTGTSVTFTATATNGGTTPVYQWKLNGGNVGSNSNTYTSAALVTGDIVTCQVTSDATCATGNPATSNALTMTVNSSLPVSVSIAASTGSTICAGTSVIFTATPVNGGITPTYQWKVNGTNVGLNSPTYTTGSLTHGQIVTCVLTSSEGCATGSPAISNAITMTVNANVAASISIAASPSGSICEGNSVTFTATPTNGGTPTYQWYEGVTPVGTGLNTYTTTGLTNGEGVYCVMTSNATCVTGSPATSNTINTTVNTNNPVSVSIAANPGTTICTGTSVTFTATPANPGATPVYQWKLNGGNVGSNSTTYTNAALVTGDIVTCQLTSDATCATGNPATSNALSMTVNSSLPVSVSIAAAPGTTVCAGTSVAFTATPVNGGGTPAYAWYLNGGFTGTGATYTNVAPANGDQIYCILTSDATCVSGNPATSNTLALTVNAAPSITSQPVASTIGDGGNTSFSVTATGAGLTYQWQISTDDGATYNNILAAGTNPVYSGWATTTLGLTGVVTANDGNLYRCVVTGTCAPSVTSNGALLTVNNAPAITSHPANSTVCTGLNTTFSVTATGTITGYQWQVSTNGGATFNNISAAGTNPVYSGYTTQNLTLTGVVAANDGYQYRCIVSGPVPPDATSNAAALTVQESPVVTVNPVPASICNGANTSFAVTATGDITTYQWQVSTDGGTTYNNILAAGSNPVYAGYNTATLSLTGAVTANNGYFYRCVVTGPCTPEANTTGAMLTVNASMPVSVVVLASPAGSICSGTSVTYTATPANGGTTPVYTWYLNGSVVGGSGNTYTNATLSSGDAVNCILTSNIACATGNPATSNVINVTVNPTMPVSVSIAASPAGAVCDGTPVTFTAMPANGGSAPAYNWFVNGSAVASGSSSYTSSSLNNGDVVTCTLLSDLTCASGNPATSNGITMDVNPGVPVSVSIAASPAGAVCEGTSVTFTATPVNGGITPVFEWYVNGVALGINNNVFTSNTLSDGDAVTCTLTSDVVCATGNPATSNIVNMTVNPDLPVSVSISSSATTICAGTSVTFTASVTNGGVSPVYEWFVNAGPVGSNSPVFSSSTLANGDVVTCVVTSNATCATGNPATSNAVTMTVNPDKPVSVTIAASPAGTICEGTSVTFTATPVNGGTTPVYQWFVNGSPVGSNSPTFTSGTMLDNQTVACVVNSNAVCATGNPAASNTIVMDVAPLKPVSISIAASPAGTICEGTPVTFTATAVNGGTTPVYSWYVNGVSVGSNSATFASSTLNNSDAVTCELTSNIGCATGSPATSNTVTMSVTSNLAVSVNIAASATTICSGTAVTFTATPVNGGTSPDYAWFVNGASAGFNSATFTTNALSNNDVVTCIMTSGIVCVSGNPATSNAITMTVNPDQPVSVTIAALPAGTICAGTSVTFTATAVNGGSTPVYQWYVSGAPVGSNNATYTSNALQDNQIVTCVVTSAASCASGNPAVSNAVVMDVNPLMPASVAIAASPAGAVCEGTPVTFTATPVNGGITPVYAWYVNGVVVSGNSPTFTTSTLANNDAVSCVMTSNATCVSGSPATSNVITMTVNPNQPVSVSIAGVPPGAICAGTAVTFVATPVNGGNNPVYAWYVNSSPVGSNTSTYTSTTLANNDVVTCVLTSNATCATGSPATSNAVTMAVNPVLTPSVSIAASASDVCAGAPVTFTATATDAGTAPVYAWYVNGILLGPNSSTYSNSALANGDAVSCVVMSNSACANGATASSNVVSMIVHDNLPASVSIVAVPGNSICSGTNVTFVASEVNGGSNPSYTWYANGVPVGSTAVFSSSTLSDGNTVSCVMTSDALCATGSPATSNNIVMTVGDVLPVSVSVTANPAGQLCSGQPVTFTANAINGGSNPVYAWFVNGSSVGSNAAAFTSGSLMNNDVITCTVTSDLTCASGSPATLSPIVMNINDSYPVSVSVAASPAGAVCSGVPVTFAATAVNGGTTPVYQWYVNGVATGANLDTYVSSTLETGDVITCEVTSDLTCAMNNPATSAPATITVNETLPVSVTIAVSPSASICEGTELIFTATGVNGGVNPTYAWTVNGSAVGTNSSTFAATTLINGDVVSCTMTSDEVCTGNNPAVSNDINIVIAPYTVGGVMSSMETEVCEGESTGTVILSGNVGDILYWQRRIDGGTWTNIPGTTGFGTFSEITTAAGVWEYRAVIQSGVCSVDTSALIGINVLAAPVASFTYNNLDPTFEFINTSFSATSYSWTFGDGGTSTAANPVHTYTTDNTFNVTLTAYNGVCQNVYSTTVDVISVSVIELDNISLQMFPNPSNGEFDIMLSGTNTGSLQMEIYDVTGRLIRAEDLSSMNGGSVFHVTLGEVNAGLYNVRFTYNEQSITRVMVIE